MSWKIFGNDPTGSKTITAQTDLIKAQNVLIKAQTDKIDSLATDGLLGVNNSLAYRVHEIEKHFHNQECWRGKKAAQTATEWADDVLTPFQCISGNNDYGSDPDDEALVLGVDDTPFILGRVKFDAHRIFIDDVSSSTLYKMRFIWGTGTMADAITAGQFSCIHLKFDGIGSTSASFPVDVKMPRLNSGVDKLWAQCWNVTDNATVDFLIGIHEYQG